jgi:hypothetical protein
MTRSGHSERQFWLPSFPGCSNATPTGRNRTRGADQWLTLPESRRADTCGPRSASANNGRSVAWPLGNTRQRTWRHVPEACRARTGQPPRSLYFRKALPMHIPNSAGPPMHVPIWPADGIVIECASGDDHLAAAASRMGQRRTTLTAECRGKAARRRKIEARDMLLTEKPPKGWGFDHRVCCMSCPCCLSASRTVTVDKAIKRQGNLKAHAAAKAAATYFHSETPLVSRCRPVTALWLLATGLPASREKLRTLERRPACTPALSRQRKYGGEPRAGIQGQKRTTVQENRSGYSSGIVRGLDSAGRSRTSSYRGP